QQIEKIKKQHENNPTTHKKFMIRIPQTNMNKAPPQKEKRKRFHLIFRQNIGTSHFNNFPEKRMNFLIKFKKRIGVEAGNSLFFHNIFPKSHSVGSHQFPSFAVPKKKVVVMFVKFVQIIG